MLSRREVVSVLRNGICSEHAGIMLCGSFIGATPHHASDIDIIIIDDDEKRFVHQLVHREGFLFDIFTMPTIYAFYLIHKRDQMWMYNFTTGEVIQSHNAFVSIKKTSKEIIESEAPIYTQEQSDLNIFYLKNKLLKIKNEINPYIASLIITDFLDLLNQHLHLINKKWPGLGSRKEKIRRLLSDFGPLSASVKDLIIEKEIKNKISQMEIIIRQLDGGINRDFIVQNVDVTSKIDDFLNL